MRRPILAAALLTASLTGAPWARAEETGYAAPGDTGEVRFDLRSLPGSETALLRVVATPTADPDVLETLPGGFLGPVSLEPGAAAVLSYAFSIKDSGYEGPVTVTLRLSSDAGQETAPALSEIARATTVVVDASPPLVLVSGNFLADQGSENDVWIDGPQSAPPTFPIIGPEITIVASDLVSGVGSLRVEDESGGTVFQSPEPIAEGINVFDLELEEGVYTLIARDKLGNESRGEFPVDYGVSAEITAVSVAARSISGRSRAHFGVDTVRLVDASPSGPNVNDYPDLRTIPAVLSEEGGGSTDFSFTMSGIPNGSYNLIAVDALGASTLLHAHSIVQVFQATNPDGSQSVVMQAFSVSPPFFTPSGAVKLRLPDGRERLFEMTLDGVSQTGQTAVWFSNSASAQAGRFTDPIGSDLQYNIATTAVSSGTASVRIGYDHRGLAPWQEQGIKLLQLRASGAVDVTASVDTGAHAVSGRIAGFDPLMVSVPSPSTFTYAVESATRAPAGPELTVESHEPTLALAAAEPAAVAQGLADLRSATGRSPVGGVYALTAAQPHLRPWARLVARFDPALLPAGYAAEDAVLLVSTDGFRTAFAPAHAMTSVSSSAAYGELGELAPAGATTYAAVFGRGRPPSTELVALGPSFVQGNRLFASTATPLRLVASVEGATTYLKTDGGAYAPSTGPFTLSEGTRTLTYYSRAAEGGVGPEGSRAASIDGTPPVTQFSFTHAPSTFGGVYTVPAGAALQFLAVDPPSAGVSAGSPEVRYLVDASSASCPNGLFAEPDPLQAEGTCGNSAWRGGLLPPGYHTVVFAARDAVGNEEPAREIAVSVTGGPHSGGLALGEDSAGRLWAVSAGTATVGLARVDAAGALVSSVTLPHARAPQQWSVMFDPVGRTYAVGSSSGPDTRGTDLAVYEAEPSGTALASTRAFDSGFARDDFAFDAVSPGWIAGAAQTAGPAGEAEGERAYAMALWRFDSATGALSLATAAASAAGLAAGTGVQVDESGAVWVAGFLASGSPPDPSRPIDLAVWRYDPAAGALSEPFLRRSFLAEFDTDYPARVRLSSAAVIIAAPRARPGGGTDIALVSFSKADGRVLSEVVWRPSDASTTAPAALIADGAGWLVAGSFGTLFTSAGLWRYATASSPASAARVEAGGARGAVKRGSELWLAVDGAPLPLKVVTEDPAPGAAVDGMPPRVTLVPSFPFHEDPSGRLFVTALTPLRLEAPDDYAALGDGAGPFGVKAFVSTDGGPFVAYAATFSFASEGAHSVAHWAVDAASNAAPVVARAVVTDLTAPHAALVSTGALYSISAEDPGYAAGLGSGVGAINYLVDGDPESCEEVEEDENAPRGTCANTGYAGPFALAPGTHTVFFQVLDKLGNGEEVLHSSFVVVGGASSGPAFPVAPSSGPIGIPFTIAGPGFGAYAGANTRVLFGDTTAAISVWNDAQIKGTVPGLAAGTYAVTIFRQWPSSASLLDAGSFVVAVVSPTALSPPSGPIGVPFTLTGPGFGPYAGANTRVLFNGTTAAISLWNDAQIKGTVPGIAVGTVALVVERQTGGFVAASSPLDFEVTRPSVTAVTPSSAPIGAAYTLAGTSFGPYAGANTRVLIGGATTPISVWNDTQIKGTVPGTLSAGEYDLIVERLTAGASVQSEAVAFRVLGLDPDPIAPSSGPVGIPFTINGAGFGAYAGANTRVLFGDTTAAISVWNDSQIKGTVPGLSTGAYSVIVERQQGAGVSSSFVSTFTLTDLVASLVTPSSAPVGAPFTIAGPGFGPYAGANTRVLIGGATAPISVWNDLEIKGTVPGGAAPGLTELVIERQVGAFIQSSEAVGFEVLVPAIAELSPSSGPIGIAFTINGSGFGPYAGSNSRVLFSGTTAPISVWNDQTIKGTVPALAVGTFSVIVEREQGGVASPSTAAAFVVADMLVADVSPSSAPIGAPVTITGGPFGAYAGANTRLLIGGATAAVSVWNDATIKITVPPLPEGAHALWVERKSGNGVQSSATTYFSVLLPSVGSLTPSSAPIGAPFTLAGSGFGPYAGANTRVLIGGATAPISVWNDATIKGTVPGVLEPGAYELVVERVSGGGLSRGATQAFEVLRPFIATMTPVSGAAGTVVTLKGFGFGPYAGSATRLLVAGSTAAVSVWNDQTIKGTIPAWLADGQYPVVVERTPAGGSVQSASMTFTVGTGGFSLLAFSASAPLSAQPDENFEGGLTVSTETGGRIETPAKAAVEVPPGALEDEREITLKRAARDERRLAAATKAEARAAGEPIEFGPEGTQFAVPVTIELPYDPALAGDPRQLAVHYYDPVRRAWDKLASEVDSARRVVRARVNHFSLYQVLAPGLQAAADEWGFRAAYAFPNPSRKGASVTFRIQPGLADSVEVRVYDAAGRKVHESGNFRHMGTIDDLNGLGAQNSYDHTWDVSGIGSGVYRYVIVARRAGQSPITKSGRVGVIK